MSLLSLSPITNSTQTTSSSESRYTLTQEDFLNLLVVQMEYQNPLDPLDNNQMASQMAQYGILSAVNEMSSTLEDMGANQTSVATLQLAGLLDKKVEVTGNILSMVEGEVSEGSYQLSSSGEVTIKIYDASGNLVRTIDEGTKDTSKQTFAWDGKNEEGVLQSNGTYKFNVSAVDEEGQSISVDTYTVNTVTGVSSEDGVVYLYCGSKKITLSDIIAIKN